MELVPWTYNNPRVHLRLHGELNFIISGRVVNLEQKLDSEICLRKNTAHRLWDGAFLLARYLENKMLFQKNFWADKRCLELGSGCGLVGIAAWILGADVTLTDMSATVEHTKRNMELNIDLIQSRRSAIRVHEYDWGDAPPSNGYFNDLDFIFGSDIVYQSDLSMKLINSLVQLASTSTHILISYKKRGLGEENFLQLAEQHKFSCEKIDRKFHAQDFQDSDYDIYLLKKIV